MKLRQGARNQTEQKAINRFIKELGFSGLPPSSAIKSAGKAVTLEKRYRVDPVGGTGYACFSLKLF